MNDSRKHGKSGKSGKSPFDGISSGTVRAVPADSVPAETVPAEPVATVPAEPVPAESGTVPVLATVLATAFIDDSPIDQKTKLPIKTGNAARTLGGFLRKSGTLVNLEFYRDIGSYVSRFTFSGKYATGGFFDVLSKLIEFGFRTETEPAFIPDSDKLAIYSRHTAYRVNLSGTSGTESFGYRIELNGSVDPNNGLIPFFNVLGFPPESGTSPKQNHKTAKRERIVYVPPVATINPKKS